MSTVFTQLTLLRLEGEVILYPEKASVMDGFLIRLWVFQGKVPSADAVPSQNFDAIEQNARVLPYENFKYVSGLTNFLIVLYCSHFYVCFLQWQNGTSEKQLSATLDLIKEIDDLLRSGAELPHNIKANDRTLRKEVRINSLNCVGA